jgi:hypothetical protein
LNRLRAASCVRRRAGSVTGCSIIEAGNAGDDARGSGLGDRRGEDEGGGDEGGRGDDARWRRGRTMREWLEGIEDFQWQSKVVGFSRRTLRALYTVPPSATLNALFCTSSFLEVGGRAQCRFLSGASAPLVISVRSKRGRHGTYLVKMALMRIVLAVSFSKVCAGHQRLLNETVLGRTR